MAVGTVPGVGVAAAGAAVNAATGIAGAAADPGPAGVGEAGGPSGPAQDGYAPVDPALQMALARNRVVLGLRAARKRRNLIEGGIDGTDTIIAPPRGVPPLWRPGSATAPQAPSTASHNWESVIDAMLPYLSLDTAIQDPLTALAAIQHLNQEAGAIREDAHLRGRVPDRVIHLCDEVLDVLLRYPAPPYISIAVVRLMTQIAPNMLQIYAPMIADPRLPMGLRIAVAEEFDRHHLRLLPTHIDPLIPLALDNTVPSDLRLPILYTLRQSPTPSPQTIRTLMERAIIIDHNDLDRDAEGLLRIALRHVDPSAPKVAAIYDDLMARYRKNRQPLVRERMLIVSGAWGHHALPRLKAMARSHSPNAFVALEAMGAEAVETLIELATTTSAPRMSAQAIGALKNVEDEIRAAVALARVAVHAATPMRVMAMSRLHERGTTGRVALTAVLTQATDESEPQIWARNTLVQLVGFGFSQDEGIRELLLLLEEAVHNEAGGIQDHFLPTADQVVGGLALLGIHVWAAIQERLAKSFSEDRKLGEYLKKALTRIAEEEPGRLRTLFRASDLGAQRSADRALDQLGSPGLPVLIESLLGKDKELAQRAANVLADSGVPGFRALAVELTRTSNAVLRRRIQAVLDEIGAALAASLVRPIPEPDGRYTLPTLSR